jgi:hypothetical protein
MTDVFATEPPVVVVQEAEAVLSRSAADTLSTEGVARKLRQIRYEINQKITSAAESYGGRSVVYCIPSSVACLNCVAMYANTVRAELIASGFAVDLSVSERHEHTLSISWNSE